MVRFFMPLTKEEQLSVSRKRVQLIGFRDVVENVAAVVVVVSAVIIVVVAAAAIAVVVAAAAVVVMANL